MRSFSCLPSVPQHFGRLRILSAAEQAVARSEGYIDDAVDPRTPIFRSGKDIASLPIPTNDMQDWRARLFVAWFCYVFENMRALARPTGAVEELIMEFKAPSLLDFSGRRLGTLYAGAGAADPLPPNELDRQIETLRPHYDKALALLESYDS